MVRVFLRESPLAGQVRVGAEVIVHRRMVSGADLESIGSEGLVLSPAAEGECELEINGLAVAVGKIVKRRGGYFFKVTRMERGQ